MFWPKADILSLRDRAAVSGFIREIELQFGVEIFQVKPHVHGVIDPDSAVFVPGEIAHVRTIRGALISV